MLQLVYIPSCGSLTCGAFLFVMGDGVNNLQPYRMIGSPMFFSSLRDAVDAAAFCGLTVYPDGRVSSAAA